MAEIEIGNGELTIQLNKQEMVGALRKSSVVVPLESIIEVTRLDRARDGIRGIRAPGTGLPGVIALGTWRHSSGKDFIAVYRNGPGYALELTHQEFERIVITSEPIAELDDLAS